MDKGAKNDRSITEYFMEKRPAGGIISEGNIF